MKSNILTSLLLILSGLALPLVAQPSATPAGRHFRTIGVGVNTTELFYQDGANPKPFSIDSDRRSVFFEYKGGLAPLVFVKMKTAADGKKVAVPVAELTLNPTSTRSLLIFHRIPNQPEKLGVVALDDDARSVPPGGYRFVNFLPIQAGVVLAGKKQIISPQGSFIADFSTEKNAAVLPLQVYIITGDSAIPIYSNVWAPDARKRSLVLLIPSNETPSGVDVKYLSESVNVIPVEEPKPIKQ